MAVDRVKLREPARIALRDTGCRGQPQILDLLCGIEFIFYLKQNLTKARPSVLVGHVVYDGVTKSIVLSPLGSSPLQGVPSNRRWSPLPHNDVRSKTSEFDGLKVIIQAVATL